MFRSAGQLEVRKSWQSTSKAERNLCWCGYDCTILPYFLGTNTPSCGVDRELPGLRTTGLESQFLGVNFQNRLHYWTARVQLKRGTVITKLHLVRVRDNKNIMKYMHKTGTDFFGTSGYAKCEFRSEFRYFFSKISTSYKSTFFRLHEHFLVPGTKVLFFGFMTHGRLDSRKAQMCRFCLPCQCRTRDQENAIFTTLYSDTLILYVRRVGNTSFIGNTK